MPTHPTAVRNGIADFVVDLLDVGTTNTGARLVLDTSGDVEVATIPLADTTSFGAAAAGVATALSPPFEDPSATGGTTTKCRVTDRDNADVILGTVGTSGTDVILSSNVITATDVVRITSMTYTAPS